jgi:hypothetical protein
LWASVQDNPRSMQRFHGWATVQWGVHLPVVVLLFTFARPVWELISILYLALVSIYANMMGHWSTWQAARVEVRQEEQAENEPAEIVDELIERTEIEPEQTQ